MTVPQYNTLAPTDTALVYQNNVLGVVPVEQFIESARGIPGMTGPKGASFYTGSGAPSSLLGTIGDSYVDSATGNLWQRGSGGWVNCGVLTIIPSGIAPADHSGAIATGGASQLLMPANAARKGFLVQNLDPVNGCWINNLGNAATPAPPSIYIPAGALYFSPPNAAPTGTIAIWGLVAGAAPTSAQIANNAVNYTGLFVAQDW